MRPAFLSDLRYAIRGLFRRPMYSLVLVATLAVGIGANAAMFTVVDGVLLEPLPYPHADRLVWVWSLTPRGQPNTTSALDYVDYRRASSFTDLATVGVFPRRLVVTGGEGPEVVVGRQASWNLFRMLGVKPLLGRTFVAADEADGPMPIVLSYGLWQRRWGGSPSVVGRSVTLDGAPYEVVGVMPADFRPPRPAELWYPMRMSYGSAQGRANRNYNVLGRLRDGVTPEAAQAQLQSIAKGLAETYPDANEGWSVGVRPMQDVYVGGIRNALWLLMGAVGLVLLVTCANLAALVLARSTGRRGEVAVRRALGASDGRVVGLLLMESVVVALAGGALGLLLARVLLSGLSAVGAGALPRLATVQLDGSVLLFTLLVSVATGLLFGLAPALWSRRADLVEGLREAARGATGGHRLQSALVVGQVALSVVLLVGAGLLFRSFAEVRNVDVGFRPAGVLTAQVRLPAASYGQQRSPSLFWDDALARVRALPGVMGAGTVDYLPTTAGGGPYNEVWPADQPAPASSEQKGAVRRIVSPGYFATMGIPLLRGRDFAVTDTRESTPVAIVSRRFADDIFDGADPVGRSLFVWGQAWQIVALVGDVKLGSLEDDARATFYLAAPQVRPSSGILVVRTAGDPAALAPALRNVVHQVDADVPLSAVATMDAVVDSSLSGNRFRTLLLGSFAVIALLLAALGLYGVLAYFVGQRTHELGIRMALGAGKTQLLAEVLGRGLALAGTGVAVGLAGALLAGRLLRGLLFGVGASDAATLAATCLVLAAVALAASFLPAWRATRVDPVSCLRAE
ncbi:MAG: ABC transporter permease [Gemmatimonadota bacterium]